MKARVKATGEIVELHPYDEVFERQKEPFKSKIHKICHLEGIEIFDGPDYWTRLEHQAAIAAMEGMCGNTKYNDYAWVDMAEGAIRAAHALVEKMKEERK